MDTGKTLILGSPGSGKTNYIYKQIKDISLKSDFEKQIFVFDLFNEYGSLSKDISIKDISLIPNSGVSINPFDIYFDPYFDDTDFSISNKFHFIVVFLEYITNNSLNPVLKSKIDKLIFQLYEPYIKYLKKHNLNIDRNQMPTILDFYNLLIDSKDSELELLASAIKIFCDGTVDIFSKKTNINTQHDVIRYNLYNISNPLKQIALLICIEDMFIRMKENHKKNFYTYAFIDDIYPLLHNNYISNYFVNFTKYTRKLGGKLYFSYDSFSDINNDINLFNLISNISNFVIFHQNEKECLDLKNNLNIDDLLIDKIKKFGVGEFLELN